MSISILKRCIHIVCCLLYMISNSLCNKCVRTYDGTRPIRTTYHEETRCIIKHVCEVDYFPLHIDSMNPYYSYPPYDIFHIQLSTTHVITERVVENRQSNGVVIGEIHIENQHLDEISSTTFEGLSELQEIRLSRNDLTNIKEGTFYIPKLQILDLSLNKLKEFNRFSLKETSHLKLLNLSSNFLQVFDVLPPISSPQLNLDLSFNELTNFEFKNTSRNLDKLNLSHNSLKEIKDCFPACSVINLSNNKLRSITNVSCSSTIKESFYINLGSNLLLIRTRERFF